MSLADRLTRLPQPFDAALGRAARARHPWARGALGELIAGAVGSSPYLDALLAREGDWLRDALEAAPPPPEGGHPPADPLAHLPGLHDPLPEAAEPLAAALRQRKRRVALYVALADLGGAFSLAQVSAALGHLAEVAVAASLRAALAVELRARRLPGMTEADLDSGCGIAVLAMGKLGAHELNYSSDIDLILLADEGRFPGPLWPEARPGLLRAARRMVALLQESGRGEAGGYVFRTDLRLRPDAGSTALVPGMEAAELYYESLGRTWERAAYIKARAIAGDLAAGRGFLARLVPFVWRRHLDYAAVQDIADMRLRIREHRAPEHGLPEPGAAARGPADPQAEARAAADGDAFGPLLDGRDLKLAPGGIREIEFFAQSRQLIAGGRDPGLRQPDTLGALAALAGAGWVEAATAAQLVQDYQAHRLIEHRLQMVHDAQTHSLPRSAEGWARLACLTATPLPRLRAELAARLERVSQLAEAFFAPGAPAPPPEPALSAAAQAVVARWRSYPALRSPRAVQIFRHLRPQLLARLQATGRPDEALTHLDAFLQGLPAGVQIFSLLQSNPVLIDLLVDISATAPALAEYLGRNAGVFDAVIDGAFFQPLPARPALARALGAAMAPAADYEAALNAARRWWREAHFRVGVHHLRGLLDAEGAGRAYAALARATLAQLFPRVLAELACRHGPPPGAGAALIGMGSLGAGWLTAGSDLDLLVIYDAGPEAASDGPRPLPARSYYARLTQMLVTALSAQMPQGRLYEVDMRLRPSGRQGPVATALAAFRSYQQAEAEPWEHLALTRARPVAGSGAVGAAVEQFRRALIARPRDRAALLEAVSALRARITAARGAGAPWDFKHGPGGLQEIELTGQTAALLSGSPRRDTPAQLAAGAACGWLTGAEARRLTAAWQLQQRLRTTLALLSARPADPAGLGPGAERLLARAADGAPPVTQMRARAAEIVANVLSRTESPG